MIDHYSKLDFELENSCRYPQLLFHRDAGHYINMVTPRKGTQLMINAHLKSKKDIYQWVKFHNIPGGTIRGCLHKQEKNILKTLKEKNWTCSQGTISRTSA